MSRITHTNHTSRNLAARMGRWSASHWKTATFGWLAFVLIAFGLGGMVGTRNIESTNGPGESGRMNRILDDGVQAARRRARTDPARRARSERSGFPDNHRGRRRPRIRARRGRGRSLAARLGQRGPDLEGRTLRARRVPDPRPEGRGGRQDRRRPRGGRRLRARPSGLHDRRVRRRKRGEGRRDGVRRGSRQGRDALAADHADRARAHVRLARGRRDPAPARADRRLRDLRARRGARACSCRSPCRLRRWCS